MSIATIGAFSIASYREAVAVMLFYQVGELFQDLSVSKSRKSIKSLMALKPDYANLLVDEKEVIADPQDIEIGSLIVIKPGERVPIDGTVVKGDSLVDTSALTGESVPREVSAGDEVLSGTINLNSVLILKTVRKFSDSAVSRILELVESAGKKKAKSEKFITRFAKYYTPIVVFLALGLAVIPPLVTGAGFGGWINRALVFLVVSCPCALVLSVPLAFFGGIGKASRSGILVKGSEILEKLKDVDTVVFDKTGTLTHGEFSVSEISPASGFEKEEILKFAAYAESFSSHPIAVSILKAYDAEPDRSLISDYKEIAGYGISANVDGRSILVGKKDLLLQNNIEVNEAQHPANTIIYVAVDNVFAGTISISDRIKSDSKLVVPNLKALGVSKVAMLTGDNIETANRVAEELNIDRTEAGLLPQDKVNAVERLKSEIGSKGSLVFVGDGINDSPVLALADVGVAMGGLGSDAAIEAADAVIMTDEPSRLVSAIKIARKTNRIVIENIVLSLGVKGLILILAALNLASMWIAVFGDVGVAVLAVLNSVRIINSRK
jgi:Cd2+/Zn2+-exporting ATPase